MPVSRCCLASSALAIVLAGVALRQFYGHIDQGVTLAYAESVSDERSQAVEQLRALALGELRGRSREDIIRLIEAQGRTWFGKDGDALIVADAVIFEFDGQGLTGIRSAFEPDD